MSEEFTPPRTRREWLMQERARLYKALNDAIAGYDDLVSGRIQSYSLGTRSITRYTPDLNALSAFITPAREISNTLLSVLLFFTFSISSLLCP